MPMTGCFTILSISIDICTFINKSLEKNNAKNCVMAFYILNKLTRSQLMWKKFKGKK